MYLFLFDSTRRPGALLCSDAVTLRFLSWRVGMVKLIKVGIVAFERT